MPFKSEKQRKWMHANEPEMAKDWEKKESLKENRAKLVKNLIKVYKDLDKKFKNYDHTHIRDWGKVTKHLTKKFGGNKKLAQHIALSYNDYRGGEDIKKNITNLIKYAQKMTGKKLEAKNKGLWHNIHAKRKRGEAPAKPGDKDYPDTLDVEATTTSVIPPYDTPKAFKKSTYKAIQVDDEDDSDELLGGIKDYRKKIAKLDKKESFGAVLKNLAKHAHKKRMHDKIKSRQKAATKRKRDSSGRFEYVDEKKNPKREKVKKDFLKSIKNLEKNVRRIKQFARANQWGPISSFVEDGLVYDIRDLEREIDQIISMPVDINESIKVRNGETAMEGKWKVYDSHSGKTIKEVGSPRAATRLMNRLMSSGQYKEITTKWVGETVNEADDHELEMAHGQLERSIEYSQMILKKLQDGGYDELPGWVQGKLTKSMDYLQSVFNYYDGKDGLDEAIPMKAFSSSEARKHINHDIKKMSKHLGKASQQVIRIMMDGVKGGKYTAMDIARGIKEGPASRTHFGELGFIQQLWNKVRDGFRRYSKDRKLS
jgi:hypothetical protein